jgi:endonuclease YncB( thermonuclease family)
MVIKVLDGDTIDILCNGHPLRIRLNGIDAPEKGMPYGKRAKEFVLERAARQMVRVEVTDIDKYGRSVGDVYLADGRCLNRLLVEAGYAWWYRKYSTDASLGALEDAARAARRGLWQEREPLPPWEWRKLKRQGHKR